MIKKMDEKIDILLSRYFSGEATVEELSALDRWLAQSTENEEYFEEMTAIFQYAGFTRPMPEPDTEKALAAFQEYCRVNERSQSAKEPKSKTAFLNFSSGIRGFAPYISVAASILLILGASIFFFKKADNHVYLTAEKAEVRQELFNGVFVTLAAGTEIAYNPENKQEVILKKGEAAFDINSSGSGQLLVQAGETFIKDIGTRFTVIAHYPEESVTVNVTEGEVVFYTSNNSGIHVMQSEKGIFDSDKNHFKHIAPLPGGTKAIEFNATPLSEVIQVLSEQYNADIKTNADSLNSLQISVSFDPNESIENILTIISETLSMRITKNTDGTFVFSY
ncbi:MAG: DUF4974 domain-containing protein [Prevotellaceae bacterium]|jgi:ferric-dicitrate binding protein FerR (iron transport regulator)|nr:DUF4974 domain-containing protein [Prevotellaceae bacterium]